MKNNTYINLSFIIFLHTFILSTDYDNIDSFEANQKYDKEFNAIKNKFNKLDPESLWRMARAYFNQAEKEGNQNKKNQLFYEAYNYSKQALSLDSNLAKSNHWYAVLHGQIGLIEGTKQKIINSYDVLKYGQFAIKIDPNYDNTHHLLGRLNFELANLSWIEKNFASLIYATPPEGSFNEAKNYFQTAIDLNENDIRHWLWLGKTYIALGDIHEAIKSLKKAISITPNDQKDKNNIQEAKQLLNNF